MNGWLVVARCGNCDVPIGLFTQLDHAYSYGRRAANLKLVAERALEFMGEIVTKVLCVDVIEFVGGVPVWQDRVADEVRTKTGPNLYKPAE